LIKKGEYKEGEEKRLKEEVVEVKWNAFLYKTKEKRRSFINA
jgi:hypothetical protein